MERLDFASVMAVPRRNFPNENDKAIFILDVLCLAMQLHFEKRDVRKKQLLTPGNLSSSAVDDTDVPGPCRWFLGREQELEQLHALLKYRCRILFTVRSQYENHISN